MVKSKIHTTNYFNTFISVADDCPAVHGQMPAAKGGQSTIASMQFELISQHPYRFTSDEILFQLFAERNDLLKSELNEAKKKFFSKGQACLRSSTLAKRYGWGFHFDEEGKVAIYPVGSDKYNELIHNTSVIGIKAMRSARK